MKSQPGTSVAGANALPGSISGGSAGQACDAQSLLLDKIDERHDYGRLRQLDA